MQQAKFFGRKLVAPDCGDILSFGAPLEHVIEKNLNASIRELAVTEEPTPSPGLHRVLGTHTEETFGLGCTYPACIVVCEQRRYIADPLGNAHGVQRPWLTCGKQFRLDFAQAADRSFDDVHGQKDSTKVSKL
jgi:hypothetical protein